MNTFASDNFASVHPKIMEAIQLANIGHAMAYGDDEWSKKAVKVIQQQFGSDPDVYFVFNGTGANVCCLAACVQSYESVLCAASAHIYVDECGAPERLIGTKLQPIETANGKLTPELLLAKLGSSGSEHHVKPRVLSITQCTELGTLYTFEEMRALSIFCKQHNLLFHVDGARIANAAAALNLSLKELCTDSGVDVLSLGGTKNGLMFGEAIIVFNKTLSENLKFIRKQHTQLASKGRFLGAQFFALFTDNLWLKNAQHANAMAKKLALLIQPMPKIEIIYPVESNALFVKIDSKLREHLLSHSFFWDWDTSKNIVRWMTSFDTREENLVEFVNRIKNYAY